MSDDIKATKAKASKKVNKSDVNPTTTATPVTEAPVKKKRAKNSFVRGTLGIALLLVFGSIAAMTVTIVGGLEGHLRYVMVAPAALFDVFIAFVAFSKILK